ncbi:MAG: aminodeoxychorismate synthase component I [Gemmatimonadota bacterium]
MIDFPGMPRRIFARPLAILRATTYEEVRTVIREAEAAASRGCFAVGFVSYEAAPAFDSALRVRAGARMPLAWFGSFDNYTSDPLATAPINAIPHWTLKPARADYTAAVERVREEIAAGHTYQVNLTARFSTQFDVDPFGFYESLRRAQGPGYHAYLETGDFTILSASPELFFELRDRRIRARPMKGTRPRGRFTAEDERIARELAVSEKDRAENLMIVDLLRNDLGRIAETGSVEVRSLFDIEQYRTVHQMTSTIEATPRADASLLDVFSALFPCGSVTGAPKISTLRLITELEQGPRDVYCGAIGVIEPGGSATFIVAIRTLWLDNASHAAEYGAGGGITYDSVARAEYAELLAKAAVLLESWPEFELLETMRLEHGRIARLDRHIARLLDSARYFGIPADERSIRAALNATGAKAPARLRLLVNQAGEPRVEIHELDVVELPDVGVAPTPVQSSDRFLFHKTTHRDVYEQRLAGWWDVLLWNEHEQITEFTRGNVVLEIDGALLTPARACGLLAGTFRAELLEQGVLREAVIPLSDLERAARVWLINSVREWVAVNLRLRASAFVGEISTQITRISADFAERNES